MFSDFSLCTWRKRKARPPIISKVDGDDGDDWKDAEDWRERCRTAIPSTITGKYSSIELLRTLMWHRAPTKTSFRNRTGSRSLYGLSRFVSICNSNRHQPSHPFPLCELVHFLGQYKQMPLDSIFPHRRQAMFSEWATKRCCRARSRIQSIAIARVRPAAARRYWWNSERRMRMQADHVTAMEWVTSSGMCRVGSAAGEHVLPPTAPCRTHARSALPRQQPRVVHHAAPTDYHCRTYKEDGSCVKIKVSW